VEKGVAGVGVGEERPEEAPGAKAELVRCSAGAPVWRSGVAAAAQSCGTAEWGGAAAARFRGGRRGGDRVPGGAGWGV